MINHDYKFIFVHIPKSAGNSIKETLGIPKFPGGHFRIRDRQYEKCQKYFKFAFVRNPWDRFVSAYSYLKHGGIGVNHLGYNPDLQYFNIVNKHDSFTDFIKSKCWMEDTQETPHKNRSNRPWLHFDSCHEYVIIDGQIGVDFIGKTENLQEDFNTICDKIGIPRQQLPHKNKSKHKHYTEYYNDETKEIVAKYYAKDIESFGYEF